MFAIGARFLLNGMFCDYAIQKEIAKATQFCHKQAATMDTNAVGVADLTHAELYELVFQLKQCNESAPEEMRRLLQEQPELARAIAQAQLKLGMVRERQDDDSTNAPTNAVVRIRDLPLAMLRVHGRHGTYINGLCVYTLCMFGNRACRMT